MGKLDYRGKREIVTKLFLRNVEAEKSFLYSIQDKKERSYRVSDYCQLLMKIVPSELAMMGKVMYVFNGEYYEPLELDNVKYGLEDFLYECRVNPADRGERELYMYVNRIVDRAKEHQLHPRLSLMCFLNCVVDFNTMKKYRFDASLDVVKQYDFHYDRREIFKCETWNAFLGEDYGRGARSELAVLPERPKRRLLQMFLGACLVDRRIMNFEYFMVLQGVGANGKSVINKVLADLFGLDEMLNIKMSQFARSGDEGLRAISAMRGKRMLHCTESSRHDFKDTSVLKALSSGEPMAGRGIGQNISTVVSPPILIANSNYRWSVDDFGSPGDALDISVKRRAVIVNFERSIPVEKRDALLPERLKGERAGIFAWIVKGLEELRLNGWKLPEMAEGSIDEKLEELRGSVMLGDGETKVSGSVMEWLTQMTISASAYDGGKRFVRTPTELLSRYEAWCERLGIPSVGVRKFGLDLVSLGLKKEAGRYVFYVNDAFIAARFETYVPELSYRVGFKGTELSEYDFVKNREHYEQREDSIRRKAPLAEGVGAGAREATNEEILQAASEKPVEWRESDTIANAYFVESDEDD